MADKDQPHQRPAWSLAIAEAQQSIEEDEKHKKKKREKKKAKKNEEKNSKILMQIFSLSA